MMNNLKVTKRLTQLAVVLLCFAVGSCVSEPPKYDDAALGAAPAASSSGRIPPSGSKVGLVINGNTEKSLEDAQKGDSTLKSMPLVNTSAVKDIDPTYYHARILAALKRRYPSIAVSDSVSASTAAGNTYTAVLDVRTRFGKVSGDKTSIDITVAFFDKSKRPVSRIIASGTGVIPYPAWDVGMQRAADQAVEQLAAQLGG